MCTSDVMTTIILADQVMSEVKDEGIANNLVLFDAKVC